MSEAAPSLPARQRLTLKILLPMSFGVLILLILFVAIIFWSLDREIQTNLNNKIADIDVSFQHMLDQQVQIMRIQLEQLAQSTELQQLMQQHNRSGLLAAAEPTFEKFLKPLQVSHLYFLNPDQTVFLRVHNPSRYGDLITRHTLQQAVTTQKTTHGVELGPLGTFTLRTVLPWVHNGKLLGYLELGKEIDLLIKNFFQYNKTALTLTIDKRFLKREQWEIGVQMLGKNNADWNLLPDKVVVQTSIPAMLPEILKILQEQQRNPDKPIELTFAGRKYRGRLQPLSDSAHHQIGEFLVLLDVTDTLTDYMRTVSIAVFLYLLATGGFLFFITSILGKTEAQLKTTDDQLVAEMTKVHKSNIRLESEIEERKTAEAALSKIHDELEERVRERTEQLWLSLEQTRQTRKQLTDIITSVTDALIVTDLDGKLQLLNPSAEQLFQCKADDCLGQPLKNIIHDTRLLTQLEEVLQQQLTDQRIQFTQISPDLHKPLFLQARTSIITDETNKAAGMIFLIHDISHEREMDRMKSEFISTAVHELSTPLTAIMGYSELLLSEQQYQPEEQREFLTIINEKSAFLSRLVGEILDINRIESGKPLELHKAEYSVAELFERPIRHCRHFSDNHPFSVEIDEPEFLLSADREKIWQVMENLCSNAVKYSPAGGEIKVSGQPTAKGYRVTVSDQGVGMTREQTARVFEKFYRGNQSDTSIGGTGLGMTIVKTIVEAHGGQVWVDSDLGRGTRVHFILPK